MIPDCEDLGIFGCSKCYDEGSRVITASCNGNTRRFRHTTRAPYLWQGECWENCEDIEGENLVNANDGTCVCAPGYHDTIDGYCLSCAELVGDPNCEECDFDGTYWKCLECRSSQMTLSHDLFHCWDKIFNCEVALTF